jgi:hypothetical protein
VRLKGAERWLQELSEAARTLLLEVSQDPGGLILRLATLAGRALLKTNGKTFADDTPSEEAQWESGVRQLVSCGLVEAHGDKAQVLSITDKGHQAANLLRDGRCLRREEWPR